LRRRQSADSAFELRQILDTRQLVEQADARVAGLERDLAALAGRSDIEALKSALEEFDDVWSSLDLAERARVLLLILDEVVVDGATGDATLMFREAR
jgi:hypothetical protein